MLGSTQYVQAHQEHQEQRRLAVNDPVGQHSPMFCVVLRLWTTPLHGNAMSTILWDVLSCVSANCQMIREIYFLEHAPPPNESQTHNTQRVIADLSLAGTTSLQVLQKCEALHGAAGVHSAPWQLLGDARTGFLFNWG